MKIITETIIRVFRLMYYTYLQGKIIHILLKQLYNDNQSLLLLLSLLGKLLLLALLAVA